MRVMSRSAGSSAEVSSSETSSRAPGGAAIRSRYSASPVTESVSPPGEQPARIRKPVNITAGPGFIASLALSNLGFDFTSPGVGKPDEGSGFTRGSQRRYRLQGESIRALGGCRIPWTKSESRSASSVKGGFATRAAPAFWRGTIHDGHDDGHHHRHDHRLKSPALLEAECCAPAVQTARKVA